MTKRILSITVVFLILTMLTLPVCFANTVGNVAKDATNMVENGVNGTINFIGEAGRTVGNVAGGAVNGVENITANATNGVENVMDNTGNNINSTRSYTAERTSTTTSPKFLGMNATAWSWLIVGVFGAAIVGVVWFYGRKNEDSKESYRE